MAGTEIVNCDTDTNIAQRDQHLIICNIAFHDCTFGKFQDDPVGRYARIAKNLPQPPRKVLLFKLSGRQIDVHGKADKIDTLLNPAFQ